MRVGGACELAGSALVGRPCVRVGGSCELPPVVAALVAHREQGRPRAGAEAQQGFEETLDETLAAVPMELPRAGLESSPGVVRPGSGPPCPRGEGLDKLTARNERIVATAPSRRTCDVNLLAGPGGWIRRSRWRSGRFHLPAVPPPRCGNARPIELNFIPREASWSTSQKALLIPKSAPNSQPDTQIRTQVKSHAKSPR